MGVRACVLAGKVPVPYVEQQMATSDSFVSSFYLWCTATCK